MPVYIASLTSAKSKVAPNLLGQGLLAGQGQLPHLALHRLEELLNRAMAARQPPAGPVAPSSEPARFDGQVKRGPSVAAPLAVFELAQPCWWGTKTRHGGVPAV